MAEQFIMVGMGQLAVSARANDILTALGLGSCVAVCVYDPAARVGGMIHAVLPSSSIARPGDPPAKFADQAVRRLVEAMEGEGAMRAGLRLAVLGGANVLTSPDHIGPLDIGARNVVSVQAALGAEGLSCQASDVGGKLSRTVRLRVGTGEVTVKTMRDGERLFVRLG